MAISFVAAGAWTATSQTTATPAHPAGVAAGDMLIVFLHHKTTAATISTPSGWTILTSGASTNGAAYGADAGDVKTIVYTRTYQAGDSDPTFNLTGGTTGTTGNNIIAQMLGFRSSLGSFASVTGVVGTQNTTGTSWSSSVNVGAIWSGDALCGSAATMSDSPNMSAFNVTQSGVTVGTRTALTKGTSTSGSDMAGTSWHAVTNTGTSTTATSTLTATASATAYGTHALVRLHEVESAWTIQNTAEGGTNTTAVTTGNSGGASGTPWVTVFITGTSAVTFSNEQVFQGALAYKFAVVPDPAYIQWSDSTVVRGLTQYGRCFLYATSYPTTNPQHVAYALEAAAVADFRALITTAGRLAIRSGATIVQTGTVDLPLSQWLRFEYSLVNNANVTVSVYSGWSNTPIDTLSHTLGTGFVIGPTLLRFGASVSSPNRNFYMDSFAASNVPLSWNIASGSVSTGEAFGTPTVSAQSAQPQTVTPTGIDTVEAFGTATVTISVAPQAISSEEAHGSPTATPGAVSTVPTGIVSAEAHGSPTLTPGAASVAPQGIPTGEAFGTASVTNVVTLTLTGIASTEAHGSPTVTPGGVSTTPTGIASAEAHGSPTLTPGVVSVVPQAISSAETFGAPSVSVGAVAVTVAGIASAEAHGDSTVTTGAVSVEPAGVSTGEAVGDHTIILVTWPSYGVGYGGGGNLLPDAIDSVEAFGVPTLVPGATSVAPNGITSGEAFGTVTLGRTATPQSITSTETFGTASVSTGAVSVAPTGIDSGQALGSPTVTPGTATLAPAGIASQEAAGAPTLTTGPVTLTPAGIASQEGHGTPTVTSGWTLAPTGIGSGEVVPAPAVLADQTATATGIGSAETFGTATVSTGPVSVAPTGIGSGQALGSPTLTTGYTVAASSIDSAESVPAPAVSPGVVVIAPAGVGSAEALGLVVVQAGAVVMAPTAVGSGENVSSVLVRQLWTIALQGIPSAEILEPVSISVFLAAWVDRPFTGTILDSDDDWVLRPYTGMT